MLILGLIPVYHARFVADLFDDLFLVTQGDLP